MNIKRICYTCCLSVEPEKENAVRTFIGMEISRKYAGVTIQTGTGFWAMDGHEFRKEYDGPFLEETVLIIHLSVLKEDEDQALFWLRQTFKQAVATFGLTANHLHIEKSTREALHTTLQHP